MNTIFSPVMRTLGWYRKKLLQNYSSKFVVGYISQLDDSEAGLLLHLKKV